MTTTTGCVKRRFTSEQAANRNIAHAWRILRGGPMPVRAYLCPHCGYWHTTKKPTRPTQGDNQ